MVFSTNKNCKKLKTLLKFILQKKLLEKTKTDILSGREIIQVILIVGLIKTTL